MGSVTVREFFERVSADWDEMRSSFYNERVIDALADRAAVTSASTVLDVGTGTGFIAAGLAGSVANVIGVDSSPAMLAVARRTAGSLNLANVSWVEGSVDALPLAEDSVDAAVANMVLHHAPDPAAMLAEMCRVVRPGGMVAITDEQAHDYEWMRTEQADLWLGFAEPQVEGFFGSARLIEYGYGSLGMQ